MPRVLIRCCFHKLLDCLTGQCRKAQGSFSKETLTTILTRTTPTTTHRRPTVYDDTHDPQPPSHPTSTSSSTLHRNPKAPGTRRQQQDHDPQP